MILFKEWLIQEQDSPYNAFINWYNFHRWNWKDVEEAASQHRSVQKWLDYIKANFTGPGRHDKGKSQMARLGNALDKVLIQLNVPGKKTSAGDQIKSQQNQPSPQRNNLSSYQSLNPNGDNSNSNRMNDFDHRLKRVERKVFKDLSSDGNSTTQIRSPS